MRINRLYFIVDKNLFNLILFEAQDSFMSMADHEIANEAFKLYTQQGLDIRLASRVISTRIIEQEVINMYP
jgi:dihydrolipoamide dehydrogenase